MLNKQFFGALFVTLNIYTHLNVDQLLQSMSLEQKIGQLFMVAAVTDVSMNQRFMQKTPYRVHPDYIKFLINEYHIGGVIFLGSASKVTLKERAVSFQALSEIPLLIGLDAEWGVAMRVKDGRCFDKNDLLGKLSDEAVRCVAQHIGHDCKELGIHINFAPVVDINTNPLNPIIGVRSFGDDKHVVAQKAIAYMGGLHDVGVLSCAKHFPGHGDTSVDSHLKLPILYHNKKRLYEIELWPFIKMIEAQVPAIMVGHLAVPAFDKTGEPASLSKVVIKNILRQKLKFDGLVITDGLGMRAITNHYKPGELELKALLAGNDVLLCPLDVPKAVEKIKDAIGMGLIDMHEIDAHVRRILSAKKKVLRCV